jgi:hypothetical protein
MLAKSRYGMELVIFHFQIAAVTIISLVVTSDNPTYSHWWYGYHYSFALIICFSLVIAATYSYKFATSKIREPIFLKYYYQAYM